MTDDLTKLPKWAQRRIAMLGANIASAEKKAYQVTSGASNILVNPSWRDTCDGYLPDDSRIRFTLKDGERLDVQFNEDRSSIRIYEHGRFNRLVVVPNCSNVVEVIPDTRR